MESDPAGGLVTGQQSFAEPVAGDILCNSQYLPLALAAMLANSISLISRLILLVVFLDVCPEKPEIHLSDPSLAFAERLQHLTHPPSSKF